MIPLRWWGMCCLLLSLAGQATASSDPVSKLQAAGRLQVDTRLTPPEALVPGQKAMLTLKISTDRWFAGGTRIAIPEVPGLVIMQTEQFASNASENRQGQSWVVQRWTLDVYPQRAGDFSIPPIQLTVKLNTADAGNVEGKLRSPATGFTVILPESLSQAPDWVASPAFEVSQRFDRSLEGLRVGDAFEREVLFEAADVLAMMLPDFSAEMLPGLAAYPSPPVLDNHSNRGQIRAKRSQRISYMVEAEGEYLLAAREFFWWDTQRGELQLLSLPATSISVGGGAAVHKDPAVDLTRRQLLATAAGLLLSIGVIWLVRRWLPRLPLARATALCSALRRQLSALRKPALPERLNPDSSAAE